MPAVFVQESAIAQGFAQPGKRRVIQVQEECRDFTEKLKGLQNLQVTVGHLARASSTKSASEKLNLNDCNERIVDIDETTKLNTEPTMIVYANRRSFNTCTSIALVAGNNSQRT
jgi:hypothetical protein